MGKIALVSLVGPTDDGIELTGSNYIKYGNIGFARSNNSEDVGVKGFLTDLKKLKIEPSEIAMDLLVIACTMYAADTRVSRQDFAEDGWTRAIDLYIPVSDTTIWNTQRETLEKAFKFLTGDIWNVVFRPRADSNLRMFDKGRLKRYRLPYNTDSVCLFSGGMDSFIGAIRLLEQGVRPILVGHSKSSETTYQHHCLKSLEKTFPNLKPHLISSCIRVPKSGLFDTIENTERGRSFLFLTLGAICASSINSQSKLYVPENGMISLNLPLTPLRAGSHSTRTTHPHYFKLMQSLFNQIGLGVEIVNPFWSMTKGEMIISCNHKQLISETESMSCSHPSGRYQGEGNGHCGRCVPCIIRRAAYKASGITDKTYYREDITNGTPLEINKAEGSDVLAFKYMVEKVKANPNYLIAAIRNTGPLGENVDAYLRVYRNALYEVENLIQNVVLK